MKMQEGVYTFDRAWSDRVFAERVFPALTHLDWFAGGQLIEETSEALDQGADIDRYIRMPSGIIIQIAVRVQREKFANFKTWTFRYKRFTRVETQYFKLVRAIREGGALPRYQIHSYWSGHKGKVTSLVAPTREIILHLETLRLNDPRSFDRHLRTAWDGNDFVWITPNECNQAGIETRVICELSGGILEIDLCGQCPDCIGCGWLDAYQLCSRCGGNGIIRERRSLLP